jgi:hypothetical protein
LPRLSFFQRLSLTIPSFPCPFYLSFICCLELLTAKFVLQILCWITTWYYQPVWTTAARKKSIAIVEEFRQQNSYVWC